MHDAKHGTGRAASLGALPILAAGAASLFTELTILRYLPGQIRVLGYFTNLVLLAAFLGLGLGMLTARRESALTRLSWCAPAALLGFVAVAEAGHRLRVTTAGEEFLFLEYQTAAPRVPLYPFLLASYLLVAVLFMPLGHWVGRTLSGDRSLVRYAGNLAGSLLGIGAFSALSAIGAPPWVWMACAGGLLFPSLAGASARWKAASAVVLVLTVATVQRSTSDAIWSPYQKISTAPLRLHPALGPVQEWTIHRLTPAAQTDLVTLPESVGFTVRVNDDSYQTPLDLGDLALKRYPSLAALKLQYELPYAGRPPGDVLVLGAGTGNDVAAALRSGARHVDAVEIDPTILGLGARHPEHPYADPRVETHLTDARSYLARSERTYDTIVYGLLDSHVLLGSVSNVRLDSYVFTKESFEAARRRLKPGGVLVVSHAVGLPWFVDRIRATLAAAFGRPPDVVTDRVKNPLGYVYAAGDTVPTGRPLDRQVDVLEDDWPFVYLRARVIPREYLIAIALMALSSLGLLRVTAGGSWAGPGGLHFAALGAGFLLLETRGLAVMALLLGSTWAVMAAVFAGVIVMALLATLLARALERRASSSREAVRTLMYLSLGLALVLGWSVSIEDLSSLPALARGALGAILTSLPLLASGTLFGRSLARCGGADRALAANLLGAMAGGLLEYASMVLGFRMLIPLAAALYGVAYLSEPKSLPR
jgi:SAM-dependent methyltransferase